MMNSERTNFDFILDSLTLLGVLFFTLLPLIHYDSLPDIIPTHYNMAGEPDDYGKKWTIWILPAIGMVLIFFLWYLTRFSDRFNYLQKSGEEASPGMQAQGRTLLRYLNAMISLGFAFITYQTILTAQGKAEGLGSMFIVIFLLLTIGGTLFFIVRMLNSQ